MELKDITFAMIKPDAVSQHNSGKIIDMIEQNGFNIVRLHKAMLAKDLAQEFYEEHKDKSFYDELVDFVTSGPVFIMALCKEDGINEWRKLIGATNPAQAEQGTVRNLFGTDIGKNAVHGSLDVESSARELELFFPDMFEMNVSEDKESMTCVEEDTESVSDVCNG